MRALTPSRIALGAAAAVLAALIGGYFLFFTPDSPAPLTLGETPGSTAASAQSPGADTDLNGIWRVAEGSLAGYRVREKLAALPAQSDAVGRTSAVTGQVRIQQTDSDVQASEARFEVDLTKLTSDEPRRDSRIRTQGLESNTFPTATFVATEPVRLTAPSNDGQVVKVEAVGDLTLHGVTRRVAIPMDARLVSGRIELVGSLRFAMADFAIEPPDIGGFVSVEPDATMEFRLLLQRA